MNIAEIMANAFSVLEERGDRVKEVRMSKEILRELIQAGNCDYANLWGARPVIMPGGREVTLLGENGGHHQVTV